MKKAEVIDAMLRLDAQENAEIKTERSVPENRPAERKDAPEKGRGRAQGCSERDAAERKDAPERTQQSGGCPEEGCGDARCTGAGGKAEPPGRWDRTGAGDQEERRQQRTGKRFISNGSYHNGRTGSRDNNGVRGKILQLQRPCYCACGRRGTEPCDAPAPRYNERYNSPYNRGTAPIQSRRTTSFRQSWTAASR